MFGNNFDRDRRGNRDFDRGGFDRNTFDERFDNRGFDGRPQGQNRMALDERDSDLETRSAIYLAKVMGWMCVGLLTTVVAAMAALSVPAVFSLVFGTQFGFMGIIIAQLIMVMSLSAGIGKMSPGMATVMFLAYSGLMGLTMSVFVVLYDLSSLLLAFSVTTFVFLTMSAYGFITKKDLTSIGRLCFFALIGIIVAAIANWFLGNAMLDFAITVIGVLVFIGLIAYDTQNIKGIYQNAVMSGYDEYSDELRKLAIIGALKLYLDFINLFIMLLRLLGRRR